MVFVTSHQATEVVQPCEEALDLPAPTVASEGPSVLGLSFAIAAVRSDEFDPLPSQLPIQGIGIVGAVANQPFRRRFDEALLERGFDELDLMR